MACSPPGSWDFPGKNDGLGFHCLLQGIFPTHRSNLRLLHWQVDSETTESPGKPNLQQKSSVQAKCPGWGKKKVFVTSDPKSCNCLSSPASFKSSSNKAPYLYERGELGENKTIILELKYLADIGLVGLPNAGKSTFIKTVCHVDVKIADYAFTTIHPVLGTYFYQKQKIIFCDIPGLIAGASLGKGLGHEFLKHIERCKLLLHLVSADDSQNPDIIEAYKTIREELSNYKDLISKKKIITVVTKADKENAKEQYDKLKSYLKNEPLYFISCETGENLNEFVNLVIQEFMKLNQNNEQQEQEDIFILKNNQVINLNNLAKDEIQKIDYKDIDDEQLKIYYDENNIAHITHPILAY